MSRAIADVDIKKLWGKAAGRCSLCEIDLLPILEQSPELIGEMAHIIGYKKDAARGDADRQYDNLYDNLILLCPTCHTKVDKAEKVFTVDVLRRKKLDWENEVARRLIENHPTTVPEMCRGILRLLAMNYEIWHAYGPDSKEAQRNPLSNMASFWEYRKLDTIVPNNKRIMNLLEVCKEIVPLDLYKLGCKFKEHAIMFEKNCYSPIDNAMRFPMEFEAEVKKYAKE